MLWKDALQAIPLGRAQARWKLFLQPPAVWQSEDCIYWQRRKCSGFPCSEKAGWGCRWGGSMFIQMLLKSHKEGRRKRTTEEEEALGLDGASFGQAKVLGTDPRGRTTRGVYAKGE